jgi:2-polyprenyl-6-methoxyphenol hydroxylase-like FAD-dependent oxidoreductase
LEVLGDLGVVERVLANGRMGMPVRSVGADGQVTLSGAESPPERPDVPYLATLITPEWRIEEALRSRLAELGGEVEFGATLKSFEQSGDVVSAVVVRDGEPETVDARWLAGCDGGHSLVRHLAGIAFEGETREEVRMIVADVEADGLDRDTWRIWRSDEGTVALCPLPSTNAFQYQAGIAAGVEPDLSLANMQAMLDQRTGGTGIRLREPQWSSLWRANVRLAARYREGNVFLAGDAAHIHSPAGGQGMNTGIQDSHNLGWKLAAVVNGAAPTLLDTYETERRPVAQGVLELSDERLRQMIEDKGGLRTHRDARTMQLSVGYRGSALARDDRDDLASLRAGDRAPDATGLATVDGEHRLFGLTRGGRFTLLRFAAAPAVDGSAVGLRTLNVVRRPGSPGDIADTGGHLAGAYGATDRTLVLIRPDGHVGLISDAGDAPAVLDYLATIG